MFELGLGVILALIFVGAYLIITSFFRRDTHELGGWRQAVSLNPVDTTHALGAGRSKRALKPGESGERNQTDGRSEPNEEKEDKR